MNIDRNGEKRPERKEAIDMKTILKSNDDTYDREITSTVAGYEAPTENDQSNFGTGFKYRYGETEGAIEINMNHRCCIFATEEVRQQIKSSKS